MNKITILENTYDIQYDQLFPVDRKSCFGYIDYQSKAIGIKKKDRTCSDVKHTLVHEILHAICHEFKIISLCGIGNEKKIDALAFAIVDTCFRNGYLMKDVQ